VNPSTALATVLTDELVRCGLRDAVLAPGSRSAPLAIALWERSARGDLRLHVRIDERSAAFLALGLAKAGRRPVAVLCTSGTAAASFHPAVIEADESGVPLLVLTADRPPELRGTGANQTIDQLKLYGGSVRWFCEVGVPEARPGMAAYWRSMTCRAWAQAAGEAGGFPGPVHLNLPLREPLVPGAADGPAGAGQAGWAAAGAGGTGTTGATVAGAEATGTGTGATGTGERWPELLDGRPGGVRWTAFGAAAGSGPAARAGAPAMPAAIELPWTERGAVVCGDGDYDAGPLLSLAEQAGWPVLAEPSSGARRGPNALRAYSYLLASAGFAAAHRPDVIVSAGRPGLSRGQLAFLRGSPGGAPARHVVIAQGPGRWADPARTATDVASGVRLAGRAGPGKWLGSWQRADEAASRAADEILDTADAPSEPRLARDLAAALPDGALLWAASSLPVRDLDQHMAPRDGLRLLASRGASGIDGLVSSAMGAALAHAGAGGGPAAAVLGDLAFLHDAPGLVLGPDEARPDLCLVVVNNDGGGIFSMLEPAAFEAPFERVFGTPHSSRLGDLARAAGLPYLRLERAADLPAALHEEAPGGLRVIEARTSRADQAALRARLAEACAAAVRGRSVRPAS
jgi:2-succinyl-5-enolpyruvyl-6-hydroxy-3-cyclohexene-1-carboxylate synthase